MKEKQQLQDNQFPIWSKILSCNYNEDSNVGFLIKDKFKRKRQDDFVKWVKRTTKREALFQIKSNQMRLRKK